MRINVKLWRQMSAVKSISLHRDNKKSNLPNVLHTLLRLWARALMIKSNLLSPDISLTVGDDGVIRTAVSSSALGEDSLEVWKGRAWRDTIDFPAEAAKPRVAKGDQASATPLSFQVLQRFPSGRELPIEFTTIGLARGGFVAIGKNLQAISDLQARLSAEQQAREQDYWKIREIETRYRLLFDASTEAVVLVRQQNLKIVEANLAAVRKLGLTPGIEFSSRVQSRDQKSFETMLEHVREQGRAPGIVLHFGSDSAAWSLRASLMNSDGGSFYMFQLAPIGAAERREKQDDVSAIESIVERFPDGFVVVDRQGMIQHANHMFLDLVQIGAESAVANQKLKRWLSRPGADSDTVLNLAARHGSVRTLPTTLFGEFGSSADVEISAAGNRETNPDRFGVLLRDVTMRTRYEPGDEKSADNAKILEGVDGDVPLERLVRSATEEIERRAIKEALIRSDGNRTIAAKRLGLSRQSLHAKLNKYSMEDES
jgi:transcriptional regulator PpsR